MRRGVMRRRRVQDSLLHRLFYPQVPAVIAVRANGVVGGMPATSVMHVSTRPPVIATSIMTGLYTRELLEKSRYFSVNWLDYSYAKAIDVLGFTPGRGLKDKIKEAGLDWEPGSTNKDIPVIKEAVAVLECRLSKSLSMGDHDLIMAEVLGSFAIDDFQDYWAFKEYKPILYLGATPDGKKGRYSTLCF